MCYAGPCPSTSQPHDPQLATHKFFNVVTVLIAVGSDPDMNELYNILSHTNVKTSTCAHEVTHKVPIVVNVLSADGTDPEMNV